MTRAALATLAALALATVGMMLVVAGVIAAGFFMVGVVLIMAAMPAFAIAAVLHAIEPPAGRVEPRGTA